MKPFITIVALLLGSLATASAQGFYLPVSSTSKSAIASYQRGAELYHNVHFKVGKAEFDKAAALGLPVAKERADKARAMLK